MNEIINFGNGDKVKVIMLKGEAGNDIKNIVKTATSGLVDTYTITLTDGSTHTFTVTNGSSIERIDKTGTEGLVDTYTITLTDGSTHTFTVTNGADGNGIVSITKTNTENNVDTYTITFTNGNTTTFNVINGQGNITEANRNIATIEDTNIASKSYSVGDMLVYQNKLYRVTQAIASGGTIIIGTNVEQTTVDSSIKWKYLGQLYKSSATATDASLNIPTYATELLIVSGANLATNTIPRLYSSSDIRVPVTASNNTYVVFVNFGTNTVRTNSGNLANSKIYYR